MELENRLETPEQTAEPIQDDGMVDVHDATMDDIDSALETALAEEKSVEPESSPAGETAEPVSSEHSESNQPGVKVSPPQGAESSKPAPTQDEFQALQADNERQRRELQEKELYIQRRGNELGTLRKDFADTRRQLNEVKARLQNGLRERFDEDPVKASNDRDTIKEIDQRLAGLDRHEARATNLVEAQTLFLRNVNISDVNFEDVVEVLKSDGIKEEDINNFRQSPFEWTTPEALIQMAHRVKDRKVFREADGDRKVLAKEVLRLVEENRSLRGRPQQVVNTLQRNLNSAPPLTSQSSATPKGGREMDMSAIPHMSDAELNSAIQNAMR